MPIAMISILFLVTEVRAQERAVDRTDNVTEQWCYLTNNHVRVGLLRSHGGAIGSLSTPDGSRNVLNHYDHGRLVQQSYYGDTDGSKWVDNPWMYNPVQGGDYLGHAAQVIAFESSNDSAHVETIPRNWASGALLEECRMEQWVTLRDAIVEVRYRFKYQGQVKHSARHQETPAVFVAPELKSLVTYAGDAPWTAAPLSERMPGWPNEKIVMTEGWAAWVEEDGRGIGIYVPGVTEGTCYRYQGGSGSDCSYIAPLRTFALEPDLQFEYIAYLTLGDVPTIRQRFQLLHKTHE